MKRSVFTGSPALELRDPLLDVRRDAFLRVVALEQLLLELALERQPAFERHLGPGLLGALDQAHRLGSLVRRTELLRVKDHLLPEPLGGEDFVHEADLPRPGEGERLAPDHPLDRAGPAPATGPSRRASPTGPPPPRYPRDDRVGLD